MPPGFPFDFGKAWFKSVEFGSEDEKRTEEAKKRKAVAAMLDFQDDQINRSQDIFVISKLLGWLSTKRPLNSPVIPWAPEVSIATCLKEISMVVVRWAIAACAIVLPQSGFGQVSNSRMVAGWYVAEVNSTYGPSCVTSKKMPGGTELNIKLFPDVQRLTLEFANSDWQSLTSG